MNRLLTIALLVLSATATAQQIKLVNLRTEYRTNPLGVGTLTPGLSWELSSSHHGITQSAYRIILYKDTLTNPFFDTQKQESPTSAGITYNGPALTAGHTYYWRAMVWDQNRNDSSKWSAVNSFQIGPIGQQDWQGALWIARDSALPMFKKEIIVDKPLLRATAFISGLGHFECTLNNKTVGDHFLDPGWVAYDKKALYVALDLTPQLNQGPNTLTVLLGNGFYNIPRKRYHKLIINYGIPKCIARIVLEYKDGTSKDIITDTSWQTAPSPITYSSIYGGEDYDARYESPTGWRPATIVSGPPRLEAQSAEPLKIFERFTAQHVTKRSSHSYLYDLGQNASGIAAVTVTGKQGATIRITPAELVQGDSANQKATGKPYYWEYTLKGGQPESWQPRFTYYGFRYLQLDGAVPAGEPNPDNLPVVSKLEGLHTRNAAERVGKFTTSNTLFRRIDTLIDWAIQSNLASVFTDCPHREKLGWLEEAHLMGNSMRYSYDIASLYRKVIRDMMDAQTDSGLVPEIAPEFTVFGKPFRDSPEWGSSAILLPWYCWQWYGDKAALEEAWPMMQRYMTYLAGKAENHLLCQGLGDWYDIGPKHPGLSQNTPQGITASAIYYYDLAIMSRIAELLNQPATATTYRQQAELVKTAFNEKFFDRTTGNIGTGSQAANAMALYVGIVPEKDREAVFDNIVKDLKQRDNSLTAGDIGFRYLLKVLDQQHRPDLIYAMNNRSDVPGYGYQLAKGATALTESWQALPSVSNNHLMLGHLLEWFYEGLAGIHALDSPGHTTIKPEPVGNIQWAGADYHSPYGPVSSHWKQTKNIFDLDVTVPGNTTATIWLPASKAAVITQGWKRLDGQKDIHLIRRDSAWAIFEVGSGSYNFRATTGNTVPEKTMNAIYEKIKTPYKYGLVVVPNDKSKKLDCPSIFRKGNSWYMSYIIYDGRGYETWLATSPDLLHWTTTGRILSFADTGWDASQKAGYISLLKFNGKYWMPYFGGASTGYEAGTLSIGMAFTNKNPWEPHEWQRLNHPILSPKDTTVSWWDNHTMYKSWVYEDKKRITGHRFLLYYNANGDSLDKKRGAERIGMAVSEDMVHWKRFGKNPVLDHLTGITGDPYIQKIGDIYVLFYFGAFWKGTHAAFNRFACSYDLVHWTDWTGPDLIEPSEPYDEVFAHKSFVIKDKGIIYHFYCAVDKKGNRGIAVATSTVKGKSPLTFQ
ncbi:MAG TPA: family 78 glycoside hydrolase catalytic domain [Puia sp.]|uniref:family 78 glycoside hydrolase catalytic domain n=1 Tax=Puia sp. TaxID=2045100 RepID=UPI002B72004B|nr:family 78 glycoside hydrolase catalytic domain [Puia sp.]HVU98313.1 family 78 glycoside hydrolase catalytic domain [Puia sp.]